MSNYSSIFYKADQRISESTESYKQLGIKGSNILYPVSVENLLCVNDVWLFPEKESEISANNNTLQIILPIVGTLSYTDHNVKDKHITTEQMLVLNHAETYSLQNHYKNDSINYLRIDLKSNAALKEATTFPVSLTTYNELVSLPLNLFDSNYAAFIGLYKGRSKGHYSIKNNTKGVFVLIINGVFEVEERLMEYRDGLFLWDIKEMEFEALSDFSILFILEIT